MRNCASTFIFPALLLAAATVKAQGPDLNTWLTQLQSNDCAIRQTGFYAIVQNQVTTGQGVSSASDQVKVALTNLLILEEAFQKVPSNQAVLEGACGEYFGDVVTIVAGFRDPRSIDALIGVITTGNIVGDALASFGPAALDRILTVISAGDFRTFAGLFILGKVLDAGTVGDQPSLAKIRAAFNSSSLDSFDDNALAALGGLLRLSHVPAVPFILQRVQIAIKPGESPASINPRDNGVIPGVAILSSATFDARTIDDLTARFGPGQASPKGRAKVQDVNKDGLPDMVFQFSTPESMIACGDTASFLFAKTTSGQAVVGADAIRTVGCP